MVECGSKCAGGLLTACAIDLPPESGSPRASRPLLLLSHSPPLASILVRCKLVQTSKSSPRTESPPPYWLPRPIALPTHYMASQTNKVSSFHFPLTALDRLSVKSDTHLTLSVIFLGPLGTDFSFRLFTSTSSLPQEHRQHRSYLWPHLNTY